MSDAKLEKAERLLRACGAANTATEVLDTLIRTLRPVAPPTPDLFWTEFKRRQDPNELMRRIAPRYAERISEEDLDGLIAFFESPVGQRYVKVMPRLTSESIELGRQWGEEVGAQIQAQLLRR